MASVDSRVMTPVWTFSSVVTIVYGRNPQAKLLLGRTTASRRSRVARIAPMVVRSGPTLPPSLPMRWQLAQADLLWKKILRPASMSPPVVACLRANFRTSYSREEGDFYLRSSDNS